MSNTILSTPESRRGRNSQINQTPDSQAGQNSFQLCERGKARVDAAGPNGPRCLIQNAPPNSAVQYAHVYPRRIMAKKPDTIDIIEYNWGLKRGTLNLDTRRNVIKLSSNLHLLHDNPQSAGAWMLVPPKEIIQMYYDSVTDEGRVKSGPFAMPDGYKVPKRAARADLYRYNFVVVNDTMKHNVIVTQPDTEPTAESIQIHTYPFNTLSPITSHLHHRFAILEIGRRLESIMNWLNGDSDPTETSMWRQIKIIYEAWTEHPGDIQTLEPDSDEDGDGGDDSQEDGSNQEEDQDDEDGDGDDFEAPSSEGTGMRSVKSQHSKRKREGSLTPSSKRRAHGDQVKQAHNCDCGLSCLSGETLNEYEGDVGAQTWDKGSISSWAHAVVEEQAGA